ncbi:MAG: hypothetical protein AMJ43_06305 [Coxiella sp. DG_40]|nr:MAG: hypothetical protein AMJ43_06305 [Coxiella sp. DG_40]
MRTSIREFIKICSEILPISEPIYEFGSLQVPGQEELANLRPLFPNKKYIGADIRGGQGVDLILNLHDINIPSDSAGTVLVLDTLEHVEFPRKSIEEIRRILKLNGILIMTSVMDYPIHDHPYDYWRFTPEGFTSLLKPFNFLFVDSIGNPKFPHTIVGLASRSSISDSCMQEFMKQFKIWKQYWKETPQPMSKKLVKLLVPPILITMYQKIQKRKNVNIRRKGNRYGQF